MPDAPAAAEIDLIDRPAFAPARAERGAIVVLAAALLAVGGTLSRPGDDPTPGRSVSCRLDVNAATAEEWSLLRSVGPKLAGRIVEDRAARGPFVGPPDLLAVKGVGPKTYAKLAPHLRFPVPSGDAPAAPIAGATLAAR